MAEFTAALKASESGARFFAGVLWGVARRERDVDRWGLVPRAPGEVRRADPARAEAELRSGWGSSSCSPGRAWTRGRITGWTPDGDVSAGLRRVRHLLHGQPGRSTGRAWRLLLRLSVGHRHRQGRPGRGYGTSASAHSRSSTCSRMRTCSSRTRAWAAPPSRSGSASRRSAIPQAVDQFTNAAQLESAGAGVHLPAEQVTVETLREAAAGALECAPRARELRDEIRRTGAGFRQRRRSGALRGCLTPSGSTSGGDVPIDWA